MAYDVLLTVLGLALVAKGGDLFVDASVFIGRVFRVPRFIIGGTLVSLATTTPELAVSAIASSSGDSGIALGNAIGSCICNIGLIVGTVALLTQVEVEPREFARRSAWMVSAGVLLVAFTWSGTLGRGPAMVLLALAVAYLAWDYLGIRARRRDEGDDPTVEDRTGLPRHVGVFALGAVLILLGSNLLVDAGSALAVDLGVPSIVIGLTVVAVGTSLPELVTGLSAARKGVPDLSLGNIIGANILNIFLVVGLSGTIRPLTIDRFTQIYSFGWLGLFFAAAVALPARTGRFHRRGGAILLGGWVAYVAGLAILGG